jgi:hypothetical protein
MGMPRVELSIDGDHACALLGENLQEGEAEFVKVKWLHSDSSRFEAAHEAYEKLADRIGTRWPFNYGDGLYCR